MAAMNVVIPIFAPGINEARRLAEAGKALVEAARDKVDDAVAQEFADALDVALVVMRKEDA